MYETVYTFKTARFTVKLAVAPEYDRPDWDMSDDERAELDRKITSGAVLWFVARVAVYCDGREVGCDYLGGCCYENVDQFRRDAYFYDMVRGVCRQARRAIANSPKLRAA